MDTFYIIPRIGGLAYLNNSKAACSSILLALSRMRFHDDFEPPQELLPDGSHPIHGFHPPYAHMEYFFRRWPLNYPPLPSSFIKFSFVRNPYARFYSFYRSKILMGQTPGHYYERFGIKRGCSFEECVRIITSIDPQELEHHAAPQTTLLCKEGTLLVDFLGKVEGFSKDWPIIQKLTGFNIHLQRVNVSSGSDKPVYSVEARERIYNYYRNDFKLFGYEKDSVLPENGVQESDVFPVYNLHYFSSELTEQLRTNLVSSNEKIRVLAEEFQEDPRKRYNYFEFQEELFRELLMKSSFYLETKLAKSMKLSSGFQQQKSKIDKDIRQVEMVAEDDLALIRQELETFRKNVWGAVKVQGEAVKRKRLKLEKYEKEHLRLQNLLYGQVLTTYRRASSNPFKRLYRFFRFFGLNKVKTLHRSSLVDPHYYFKNYPHTITEGMTVAEHYVRYGALQGMNPSENFNTRKYLAEHPAVAHDGINPLVHYYLRKEGGKC